MKNILKRCNRNIKLVNNMFIKNHTTSRTYHSISKDIIRAYLDMSDIYAELDSDYAKIDVIDLILYERWLNERY